LGKKRFAVDEATKVVCEDNLRRVIVNRNGKNPGHNPGTACCT
jgi:hypothetical protein